MSTRNPFALKTTGCITVRFVSGNTTELIKILAMIIGGFLGSLFLIIVCTVVCRKLRNRSVNQKTRETLAWGGDSRGLGRGEVGTSSYRMYGHVHP